MRPRQIPRFGSLATTSPRNGTALHALAAGIFAGLEFAVGQSLIAAVLGHPVQIPVHALSLALGSAYDSARFHLPAMVAVFFIHFTFSVLLAFIFFFVTGSAWRGGARASVMLLLGIAFGFSVWVVNLLLIAPLFLPQLTSVHQGWEGFFAHTFLFGAALGVYAGVIPHRPVRTYPPDR